MGADLRGERSYRAFREGISLKRGKFLFLVEKLFRKLLQRLDQFLVDDPSEVGVRQQAILVPPD
ncbi:MAG: hypothetical protein WAS73_07485 [Defluviicoccus sp.]